MDFDEKEFPRPPSSTTSNTSQKTTRKRGHNLLEKTKWLSNPNSLLNKTSTTLEPQPPAPSSSSKKVRENILEDNEWETEPEESDSDEWEEQLVYVELKDVPSIQELFAQHPDDFLRVAVKKVQNPNQSQPVKPTYPKVSIQFHQFDSDRPVVQIGQRFYTGQWKRPTGTALFFKKSTESDSEYSDNEEGEEKLKSIVPEPEIPWDPVFGPSNIDSYKLIGTADRVMTTSYIEAAEKMYRIPKRKRRIFGKLLDWKIPKGYTVKQLLAGEYRPRRKYAAIRRMAMQAARGKTPETTNVFEKAEKVFVPKAQKRKDKPGKKRPKKSVKLPKVEVLKPEPAPKPEPKKPAKPQTPAAPPPEIEIISQTKFLNIDDAVPNSRFQKYIKPKTNKLPKDPKN